MSARSLGPAAPTRVTLTHAHLFCGLGGGAKGFDRAAVRVGNIEGRWRCLGGIDSDPAAIADFTAAVGVPGTVMDLFDRDQFRAFWGREPGPDWREAGPDDLRSAFQGERPDVVFTSAPCKGFSGLLSERASASEKYQALNRLTLRGIWLTLEAYADDPVPLILFENVPRIANRGRPLLDRITGLLAHHGYAVAETVHDCGELGGLAQSRRRFLLVARHRAKVPPFLYEPPTRRLRGVGEVLERLPLPGDPAGGPMHRVPSLQFRTWVRLAFVEAGSDWRSLQKLAVEDGRLRDFGIVPETAWRDGTLGVLPWGEPAGTVTGGAQATTGRFSVADPRPADELRRGSLGVKAWGDPSATVTSRGLPLNGAFAVADPRRIEGRAEYGQYGVKRWDEVGQTVIGKAAVGAGRYAVADPRPDWHPAAHRSKYRIVAWGEAAKTVTGSVQPASGGPGVADPRMPDSPNRQNGLFRVVDWAGAAGAITGAAHVAGAAQSVADPRPAHLTAGKTDYQTGGAYGVVPWAGTAGAVAAAGQHDNGRWSVADPRAETAATADDAGEPAALPAPDERLVCVIRALDGTWHRPFTTMELAALQGLVDVEDPALALEGASDADWRERIGNAVPPPAAEAIATEMGRTLLMAASGVTFQLSSAPIWVRPVAVALSVDPAR